MFRGLLVRSRLLSACACALFVMVSAGAGCSTTTPAPTVSGKTLTLYLSAPSNLSSNPAAQAVVEAEKLAFNQLKVQVHGVTLNLRVLTGNQISANARTAIEDNTAIAYLGEVQASASVDSLGITNAQDLLQVSPAPAASVPTKDFESFSTYGRTFASVSPTTGLQAQALLSSSGGKAFVRQFRSSYGSAPPAQAIFGYAATAAVLQAIQKAGSAANNRGTVRDALFALKNIPLQIGPAGPQVGTYTVQSAGTLTITPGG